jgi:hypothetical protein
MIFEIDEFGSNSDKTTDFESAMQKLPNVIGSSLGYLRRNMETAGWYILGVCWRSLEAFPQGFCDPAVEARKACFGSHHDGVWVEYFQVHLVNDWAL